MATTDFRVLPPSWPRPESHRSRSAVHRAVERIQLHDIRQKTDDVGLVPQIVAGLEKEDKELPSLLLWTEHGLGLFDAILDSPWYYPATRETELLSSCVQKLAYTISSGETVIELGAGNMRKTAQLLHTLELQHKYVEYCALDVSRAALRSSIRELLLLFPGSSKTKVQGLLGTYEDCADWLQCRSDRKGRITLLWLGNSIANFTPDEASDLISRFFQADQPHTPPIQMIIAVDGCQRHEEITRSYESDRSRDFILNGLDSANQLLGLEVFRAHDWEFQGRWNADKCMHESFYVAQHDLSLQVEGKVYDIKQGQMVRAISSGKWPYAKVSDICKSAGTKIVDRWNNQDNSYGIYVLKGSSASRTQ